MQNLCLANDNDTIDNIKKKLSGVFKYSSFDTIIPTGIENIYAIKYGEKVIYTTKDANYLIFGEIYNIAGKNITQEEHTKMRYDIFFDKEKYFTPFVHNDGKDKKVLIIELFSFKNKKNSFLNYLRNAEAEFSDISFYTYLVPASNIDEKQLGLLINTYQDIHKFNYYNTKKQKGIKNNNARYLLYSSSLSDILEKVDLDLDTYKYAYIYNNKIYTAKTLKELVSGLKNL